MANKGVFLKEEVGFKSKLPETKKTVKDKGQVNTTKKINKKK